MMRAISVRLMTDIVMAIQKTEAYVLKSQPFRSSSLIVTFITKDFGKIRGLIKGIRKENETRGAVYEPLTKVDLVFYEKMRSDLHLISDADILDFHDAFRLRLDTIVAASYFSELVEVVTEPHDPHPALYEALDFCLRFLGAIHLEKIKTYFEMQILSEAGWLPHLDSCVVCSQQATSNPHFSVKQGGVLCASCVSNTSDAKKINPALLEILHAGFQLKGEDFIRLKIDPVQQTQLSELMDLFLSYRLPRPLRTKRFAREIQSVWMTY